MRARGFRVESVCRVLSEHGVQVAPRTYCNWKTAAPSARTVTDAQLTDALRATVGTPEGMYGRRKMTAYLRRRGHRWLARGYRKGHRHGHHGAEDGVVAPGSH